MELTLFIFVFKFQKLLEGQFELFMLVFIYV